MSKSTHRVEVVPVRLDPHPNADQLSLVQVWGYQVCVNTQAWKNRTLGAYVVPDSVLPAETAREHGIGDGSRDERIRVKKLRGVMSQGLLLPVPDGARAGDDLASHFGVYRYEPPLPMSTGGEDEVPPHGIHPCYDVDSWHRYKHVLTPGEPVAITEKIHGANGRWHFDGEKMHCGSRTTWKRDGISIWWQALRQNTWVEPLCRAYPGYTFYGEVFGQVQDLKYGAGRNDLYVRIFDIWEGGRWVDAQRVPALLGDFLRTLPAREGGAIDPSPLYAPPLCWGEAYDENTARALASGESKVPGARHIREGCVIRPMVERTHPELGRVILKIVSDEYLARKQ